MRIQDLLAQRAPFLLIDRIESLRIGEFIAAIKTVSINESFLRSNESIPDYMPNAIMLEALVQAASALVLSEDEHKGEVPILESVSKARFLKEAIPGDQLRLEVEVSKKKPGLAVFNGTIFLEGVSIAEAQFSLKLSSPLTKPKVHPTASVHPSAILEKDVEIGAYSVVGEHVYIGKNTVVEPHVYIEKWTKIGDDNHIHFGCVIGSKAQDVKYDGEKSFVEIGHNNIIREYVTINRATGKDTLTKIGSGCMLLTNVHIGHNCTLEDGVTIANAVHLGGHVVIEAGATIGGMTGIHQYVRIGKKSMTGGYARLIQDVPPFMLCDGNPAYVRGLNIVGLRRAKLTREALQSLKDTYKLLYRSNNNVKQALAELRELPKNEPLDHLIGFLSQDSSRGISKKTDIEEKKSD